MAKMPKTIITVENMTLRQAYKLAGLTGWLAGIAGQKFMDEYDCEPIAFAEHQMAVAKAMGGYADAMLAEDAEREGKDEHKKSVI